MLILWHWSEKGFVRFGAKEIKALFVYSSMAEWSILSFFCWYKSECEKVVLFSFRASYFGRIVQMWLNAILNCTTALFIAHKSTFCVVNVQVILNGERFFFVYLRESFAHFTTFVGCKRAGLTRRNSFDAAVFFLLSIHRLFLFFSMLLRLRFMVC